MAQVDSDAADALAEMGLGGKKQAKASRTRKTTITVAPTSSADRPFSYFWMWASVGLFLAFQVFLGSILGGYVASRYATGFTRYLVEGSLNLVGFFIAGMLVGILSPGRRLLEPAVGAAVSLFVALTVSWFTPNIFLHFSMDKLFLGGILAFACALAGARAGERLTGQLPPDE